jgi:hypothetical protein
MTPCPLVQRLRRAAMREQVLPHGQGGLRWGVTAPLLRGKNSALTTGLPSWRLQWLTFAGCGFKSAAKALLHSYSCYDPLFPYKGATIRVPKMHRAICQIFDRRIAALSQNSLFVPEH